MKTRRPTTMSRVIGAVSVCALMVLGVAPTPAAGLAKPKPSPWIKVGSAMEVDVPLGFGTAFDIDYHRPGLQVFASVYRNATAGRIRFASNTFVLGEGDSGRFTPQASFGAGFRAFAWGRDPLAGGVRLWAPAFDAAHSLISLDPALPCATPVDATTPVAGPFTITIPYGAIPGGRIVPSPTPASVFGNPARPAVTIRSQGGIVLGTRAKATPNGGFLFAEAIFAYGVAYGTPKLWTPAFNQRSTGLVEKTFVGCIATPSGTVTLTEHLVPQDDLGRFDLRVDGVTKAAGVGDQGSTGPVPLSNGEHTVAEVASSGTSLEDYSVRISCTEDTNPASPLNSSAASLGQIPVAAGDDWRCDVTSTRADEIDLGSITVGSTPETDHASSKQIGRLGGTVEATAADGTRYSLSIPPDALDTPTQITLTPTAVSGLDEIADATPAAVDFAPAGLVFSFPARLTITPAPGAPPVDFAASWEDGAPGVEVGLFSPGPGGSLVVEVPHFSGMASIQATLASYDNLLTLAIQHLPGFGGLPQQLLTDTLGLPGSSAAVAADVRAIYDGFVKPLLDQAGDGLVELQLASLRLGDFEGLIRTLVIEDVQMDPGPPPRTVGDFLNVAVADFIGTATAFGDSYMTTCNAQVDSLVDWFAIPIAVVSELATRNVTVPLTFCAFARLETLDWSNQLDESQTIVDGRIRGLIDAPAQTPGGIVQAGRIIFPQQTRFILDAAGATWVAGGSHLDQLTGVSGIVDLHLQRDAGPQGLTVDGTGQPLGLWSELSAIVSDIPSTLSVHLQATTGALTVRFRSPPTNVVLHYGQTTNLCVDVSDGDNNVLASTPVEWTNDGPGLLDGTTSTTNGLGVACMDYHHPVGPVNQGDTATITATATSGGDTGSDATTLTPEWAHITIETRPDPQSPYTMTTNTTVDVDPGDHVQLRITLTRSGATPSDQALRGDCEACPITVRIDSGGGELLLINDDQNESCVDCFVGLDANDQAELDWDPLGTSADTTIRVAYPDLLFGPGAGVAATVTFIQQTPNVTGTISGVSYGCGEVGLCPSTWDGSFQLNISASINPDGSFLVDSATGQVNLAVTTIDPTIEVCDWMYSGNQILASSLVFPRPIPDMVHEWYVPGMAELSVDLSVTYVSCTGVYPGLDVAFHLRGQPVYQAGQLVGFDFTSTTGTTGYPYWYVADAVTMTVSGFVPFT